MRLTGPRRGAALVVTTVAMMGIAVMLAASADVTRTTAARNELQTAADAAALAAAYRMQDAPPTAHAAATGIAAVNAVSGSSRVTVDSVRLGVWNATSRTFSPTSDPWLADAVSVVVSTPVTHMFGKLLGRDGAVVKTRATAWLAPTDETWCAKPWFITAESVLALVDKPNGHWSDITYADVRKLRDTTRGKKWTTLAEKGSSGFKGHAISLPAREQGNAGSNSGSAYRESIPKCHELQVGWHVSPVPGQKVGPTMQGLSAMCKPLADGVCYNGKGGVGLPVAIPVFEHAECSESDEFQVKGIVGFMLTGVVENGPDAGNISGYLIGLQGSGGMSTGPSMITVPKLVR